MLYRVNRQDTCLNIAREEVLRQLEERTSSLEIHMYVHLYKLYQECIYTKSVLINTLLVILIMES